MLKGTCRVKLVKTAGVGVGQMLLPGIASGERVLADPREPCSALLGLLLPMTAILTLWSLLRVSRSSSLQQVF